MSRGGPRRVEVELENSSYVEGRGVRHTHWEIRFNDAWVPIEKLRDVPAINSDPELWFTPEVDDRKVLPPGCQYRVTFLPRLPIGTRVRKRVSVPRADGEWHVSQRQMPLKVRVSEFEVRGEHELVSLGALHQEDAEARRRTVPRAASRITATELDAFRRELGLATDEPVSEQPAADPQALAS